MVVSEQMRDVPLKSFEYGPIVQNREDVLQVSRQIWISRNGLACRNVIGDTLSVTCVVLTPLDHVYSSNEEDDATFSGVTVKIFYEFEEEYYCIAVC